MDDKIIFEKTSDANAPKQIDKVWIEWDYDENYDIPEGTCKTVERCIAKAIVSYPSCHGGRRLEEIKSAGLRQILDAEEGEYTRNIEQEQLDDLFDHIQNLCEIGKRE